MGLATKGLVMNSNENNINFLRELLESIMGNTPQGDWLIQWIGEVLKQPPLIGILLVLMILDVITGLVAAAINKEVDSSFSYKGMLKKGQMLLMVAAGMMFEFLYPDVPWGKIIAGLLCLSEMISITENASRAGVPLPLQLKETLKRLRTEKEDTKFNVQVNAPIAKEVKIGERTPDSKSVEIK